MLIAAYWALLKYKKIKFSKIISNTIAIKTLCFAGITFKNTDPLKLKTKENHNE
jgi:hypothetical protein